MTQVGGAIPSKMEWRVKEIKRVLKQTINFTPTSGVTQVESGQKIIVDLPVNSLVALDTFTMTYDAWTDTPATPANGTAGYTRCRFLPRNSSSIIQNLEVKINGQSKFNVPDYNYIYNILHDYTQGQDGLNRRAIGENADPSCKYWKDGSVIMPRRGYPVGLYNAGAVTADQNDYDNYVVRSWLGLLGGNASTQIINTAMFGQITIEITLAPAGITMLGKQSSEAINAVTVANSEVGIAIAAAAANQAARPAAGNSYHLKNVNFSMVRYDMPAEYYDSVSNVLSSGATYKLYYPNYSVFTGAPVNSASKSTSVNMSISTKSLDYVIGTFRAVNYDENVDARNQVMLSKVSPVTQGRFGANDATFDNQARQGQAMLFNNSRYFVRNGESLDRCTWTIGNTRLNSENMTEIFEGVLRHFNVQNDVLGGIHPSIKSLAQFERYAFAHILSLNVPEGNDIYNVSGLDTQEIPVSINWETKSTTAATTDATWGLVDTNLNCLPVLIACYSSHLEIDRNRNIRMIN